MTEESGIRALLIGVAEYDDVRFRDVPAAINSVRAMQSVLTDPALCGWDAGSVSVLENPRRPVEVGHALRCAALESSEILLMYFVGHGTLNEEGELCLAVGESVRSEMEFSGVEYKQLRRILKKSIARTKIVILDCCYSGKAIEALAGDADIADVAEVSGAYTLTAADQSAHVPSVADPMVRTSFTNALVDVVTQGVPGCGEFLSLSTIYV
ncbi:caspase domain-containing protein, partial [Micromonospora sp. NPDC047620]|uniref:caspase family protein n=1 Tax=Micromonospora sp. NPDC047620 TaxID=3364251 RepID=UPI0037140BAC